MPPSCNPPAFISSEQVWSEMVGKTRADVGTGSEAMARQVEAMLSRELGARAEEELGASFLHDDMDMWHLDQRFLSLRASEAPWFPAKVEFVPRQTHLDRIDRMRWRVPSRSIRGFVDAHMPQPGYSKEHWQSVRRLVALLPGVTLEDMAVVDNYKREFGDGE